MIKKNFVLLGRYVEGRRFNIKRTKPAIAMIIAIAIIALAGLAQFGCDGLPPIPYSHIYTLPISELSVTVPASGIDIDGIRSDGIQFGVPSLAELRAEVEEFQKEVPLVNRIEIDDISLNKVKITISSDEANILEGLDHIALYYRPVGGTEEEETLIGERSAPEAGFGNVIELSGSNINFLKLIKDNGGSDLSAIILLEGVANEGTIKWETELTLEVSVLIYI